MGAASFIAALTGAKVKKGYAFTGTIDLWLVEAAPITTATFILLFHFTTTALLFTFPSALPLPSQLLLLLLLLLIAKDLLHVMHQGCREGGHGGRYQVFGCQESWLL